MATNGIDDPLDEWRQGDLSLSPLELPAITGDNGEAVWEAIDAMHGVMMISQSCDIVRSMDQRPFVQVAALVRATEAEIGRAIRRETPSRIHLEIIANRGLLVDLDVTATVHKSVVKNWVRTPGCQTDDERRRVAAALARHRHRFAFPDDFNTLVSPVRRWIESKRSKTSTSGNFVRAIQEVRVQCDNWDEPSSLTFYAFVNDLPETQELNDWTSAAETLREKAAQQRGKYPDPDFLIVRYVDFSAAEYLVTDRLDWEGLSDAS